MNKIKLNSSISIDIPKLIQSRMVILANSGGGKSYAIRKIAEEAVDKVQTIIIDPEGEFASLREKYDFILAGKNADVPAEVRSAGLLATRLLELGKSAVIDLYELHPQERQRFVKLFAESMINCPKELYHPVIIILDEAHEYVPEGKPSEATWAVEALASKGRKRGFCLIPASQRISKLSKNVSAECNNKLIGRASQDIDMKRAGDELGFTKENMVQLRLLKPGEFFAFGPAISDDVIKLKIGEVETAHAKVGYHGTQKVPPPSAVIKKVLAEIKDLPAEAEQEAKTVVELKKENTDLKRKVKDFATGNIVLLDTSITPEKHKKAIQEAVAIQVKAFEKERKYFQRQLQSFFDNAKKIHSLSDPTSIEEVMKTRFTDIFSPEALEPAEEIKIIPGSPTFDFSKVKKTTGITFAQNTDYVDKDGIAVGAINKGEREILTAIAQHENITTEHIAVLTGYKNTSRREYLRKLIARGYIAKEGEGYSVTDFGLQGLGDFTPLPTGSDLLHHYKQTLPDGERKLFEAMLLQHPDPVDRTTLENETGYKATSTREYLRKLIARKIVINEKGVYKLTDKLF